MLFFRYNSSQKTITTLPPPPPPKKKTTTQKHDINKNKEKQNKKPPVPFWFYLNLQKKVHLLKCKLQLHLYVSIGWSPQQQNHCRLFQQWHHAQQNECGDEQRADGVGNVPPEVLNKQGGDDDADAAQSVCHHVQEDSWNKPVYYACGVCGPVCTQTQIRIHFTKKKKEKKASYFF